jgi:hypothetical protein
MRHVSLYGGEAHITNDLTYSLVPILVRGRELCIFLQILVPPSNDPIIERLVQIVA